MITKRMLLTGFEPFHGEVVNPALEAVTQLHGRTLDSVAGRVELVAQAIPTVFGESVATLTTAIEAVQPQVVICVGQAGGRARITPERIAINVDDASIPDNVGNQPQNVPVVADGPAAYWTGLPIQRMVQALQAAGIPATISNSAGTYVCNHLFYSLMHLLTTEHPQVRGGFVHIPYLPEQVVDKPQPSMALATIMRGLEILAVVAAQTVEADFVRAEK